MSTARELLFAIACSCCGVAFEGWAQVLGRHVPVLLVGVILLGAGTQLGALLAVRMARPYLGRLEVELEHARAKLRERDEAGLRALKVLGEARQRGDAN